MKIDDDFYFNDDGCGLFYVSDVNDFFIANHYYYYDYQLFLLT